MPPGFGPRFSARRIPLFAMTARLTHQKGLDLITGEYTLFMLEAQFIFLGTGESRYEDHFHWLQRTFPQKVCYYRGYNEPLAHLIEAGADVFLMPSLFEPCGLNQMYSLKYGTVPIVRRTGGLADTVELFDPDTREGTGFVFDHADADGLWYAVDRALELATRPPAWWRKLAVTGMAQDFSWASSARQYEALYEKAIADPAPNPLR